ncbi:hypothetical protein VP01_22g2 [Puccinia sorghi]|uniref:Uncharacterized protein n=1 Tax=Puccinia sorghi TaxID=27349 RepID=A0A0L6V7Z0_9BASI|nr:hypothetical protein VP01_22g2 [Puccinia sorghi]
MVLAKAMSNMGCFGTVTQSLVYLLILQCQPHGPKALRLLKKSDGTNVNHWINSPNDLAHVLFGIKSFLDDESPFALLDMSMDKSMIHDVNKFFSIISKLPDLSVSFSPVAQGPLLQALNSLWFHRGVLESPL